jgi:SRSO17 transposase
MTQREPVEVWIVDDTGFLKQGTHSAYFPHIAKLISHGF